MSSLYLTRLYIYIFYAGRFLGIQFSDLWSVVVLIWTLIFCRVELAERQMIGHYINEALLSIWKPTLVAVSRLLWRVSAVWCIGHLTRPDEDWRTTRSGWGRSSRRGANVCNGISETRATFIALIIKSPLPFIRVKRIFFRRRKMRRGDR